MPHRNPPSATPGALSGARRHTASAALQDARDKHRAIGLNAGACNHTRAARWAIRHLSLAGETAQVLIAAPGPAAPTVRQPESPRA